MPEQQTKKLRGFCNHMMGDPNSEEGEFEVFFFPDPNGKILVDCSESKLHVTLEEVITLRDDLSKMIVSIESYFN